MDRKKFRKETKRIERKIGKSLTSLTQSAESREEDRLEQQFLESLETPGLYIYFIVKLGFSRKTVQQQIVSGREIVTDMTGNPNFPTPVPSLADVTIAIDALEAAQNNMRSSINGKTVRNQRRKELVALMERLQSYVDFASGGDPAIAETSGMLVNDPKNPIGYLPAPEWMKGKDGVDLGSLDLKWKPVAKNSGYRVEYTTNPSEGWPMVLESEKASITINGLTPGLVYYFRIATLSRAGRGMYTPVPYLFRPNVPLV